MARTPKRAAPAGDVLVPVDKKLVASYKALLATMKRARVGEAEGFDAYWESVGTILERKLYLVTGAASPEQWCERELTETYRTALRKVRVARYASPAEEAKYGAAKLDLAIAYAEAQHGAPAKGKLPVDFARLRFPVERAGKTLRLALGEVSAKELTRAVRALARSAGTSPAKPSPAARAMLAAITAVPGLEAVQVTVSDGRARLSDVPLYALKPLGLTLARLELPAPAKPAAAKPARRR